MPCAWPPHGREPEQAHERRHRAIETVNQEFYAAIESADLDKMTEIWPRTPPMTR
ncbi:Alternative dihydrofolate reductase 3 [[Actinomadura] parvosata subsp. kistnae]|nr:Alternative dihydrofolate reductase 3 [Actinomadura parvosata subsp. kistnae]